MPAAPRELALDGDSPLQNLLGDRHRLVGERPTLPDSLVLLLVAGTEEHLQIDNRAGGCLPSLDDGSQTLADRPKGHPSQGALVDQILSFHDRQALAMTAGSDSSIPSIFVNASTSSRRASARRTSRKAPSMVSLMVVVDNTCWTADSRFSLISTLVFRTFIVLPPSATISWLAHTGHPLSMPRDIPHACRPLQQDWSRGFAPFSP